MAKLQVIHGPNLNLLGQREPDKYGTQTLAELNLKLSDLATEAGHELKAFQSNLEGELVQEVHSAITNNTAFIIINPAAYTHTSIALRDALLAISCPFIEVHMTNIHARENFRHKSYLSDIAQGVITGLGTTGYELALIGACRLLSKK